MKLATKVTALAAAIACLAALATSAQRPAGVSPPPEGKEKGPTKEKKTDEQKRARIPRLAPGDNGRALKSPTTAAGRRGIACNKDYVTFAVLGPNNSGYGTALAQPRLLWYISEVPDSDCVATFWSLCDPADPGNYKACPYSQFETADLPQVKFAGIQEVHLARFSKHIELRDGIVYRWYVSVGRPSDSPSKHDVDGAFIQKLDPSAADDKLWYDRLSAAYDRYQQGDSAPLDLILPDIGFRTSTER